MRLIVAIVLLLSVTPGMSEVVETAAHVIAHGDLPHHDDASDSGGCDEHTCTPLAHNCACHASMFAQTATRQPFEARADVTLTRCALAAIVCGRAGDPPPLRPPIA